MKTNSAGGYIILGDHRPSTILQLVVVTTRITLSAAVLRVMFFAATLSAVLAAILAPAGIPNRICQHFHGLHWRGRIIADNDQLAAPRALLSRLVADGEAPAGTGVEGGGEWIVDELPMGALALECNAAHMELAVADIADRDCAVGTAARNHTSK